MKKFLLFLLFIFLSLPAFSQNWQLDDGIKLFEAKKYDDAQEFFENYVKAYPNKPNAYYYLGLIYKDKNNFSKSTYYFKKSYELTNSITDVQIAPQTEGLPVEDYLDMATIYFENKDFDKAITYLDLIEKIDPDCASAYYLKATIFLERGKAQQAMQYFLRALEISPALLDSDLAKTFQIKEVPQFDSNFYNAKAMQYFYAGNLDKAFAAIQKALEADPKNPEIYNTLGIIYMKKGDIKEAQNAFKKAVFLNRKFFTAYLNLADLEGQTGNKALQLRYLKQVLKINPNNETAYFKLGEIFLADKKYEDAINCFKKATSIDNNYFEAYLGLASCYTEKGDVQNALLTLKKAISIDGENPEISFYLAKLCIISSDFDEAQKYLEKALETAQNPNYYLELGKIYYYNENYPLAIENFENALELDLTFLHEAELYNYLGLCYYKNAQLDKAVYNFERAVSLDNSHPIFYYNLSLAYDSQNKKELAQKSLKEALSIKPKTSSDYIELSNIYYDRKNPAVALMKLNEGIEKFPQDKILYLAKIKFYQGVGNQKGVEDTKIEMKQAFGN
jgi:tetratricopeptide (TPR) repeat protein